MKVDDSSTTHRYCGRIFSVDQIERIRRLIADSPHLNRVQLSRAVCDLFGWFRPDGQRKEMSCRVAMLRMHRDQLITLPAPLRGNGNGRTRPRLTTATDPQQPVCMKAGELGELQLNLVDNCRDSSLWNELIERYHYLGYCPLPGAQLRYLVRNEKQLLALLGFGAAAWKVAPRDNWIGWSHDQRTEKLQLIVNNARFLILPWVRSKNLASRILSLAAKHLPDHWQQKYAYRPVLMETFVEQDRFQGTCYQAANWIKLGYTKGRGKLDVKNEYKLPIKAIYVYPLAKNPINALTAT
jgi:hypothetical protein